MEEMTVYNGSLSIMDGLDVSVIRATLNKVRAFQAAVKSLMVDGQDYGAVPGTDRPTLLKPGAEKLLSIMGLCSSFAIVDKTEDWEKGVFHYTVRCTIYAPDGRKVTEGLGHCNSLEDKYRYRWVWENEVPAELDKSVLRKKSWSGHTKFRIPNDEIYSLVNTILKMAEKRALVNGALRVGSLSNIFTQDMEDLVESSKEVPEAGVRSAKVQAQYISANQAKRMFALAGGDEKIVRDVLTKYQYEKTSEIRKTDYEKMCKEIEGMIKNQKEASPESTKKSVQTDSGETVDPETGEIIGEIDEEDLPDFLRDPKNISVEEDTEV